MVDDGAPRSASADRDRDVGLRELAELRDLLFGGERRQLDELRRRLDTFELTPDELAEKLPQAIALRAARDRQLALALASTVETAIGESVRRNPHEIATAIFPVLGPSIRKAIAETMAGLVTAINRAIEHSISLRGIRWRIESWRTGVPFAQIVIRHSLVYRVEQVFLVHRETGLLLSHVPENKAGDADLISSMLTAIRDFVNDSFEPRHTGELRTFAVGDLNVLVETGPQAYIAAVVQGQPPESLLPKLQNTLETIHLHWALQLASFDGDAAPFAPARPLLEDCVETVLSSDRRAEAAGLRRFAWLVPALLIAAALAWWGTRAGRRWEAALARLEAEPGIAVIHSERAGGRWNVTGLRDPLSVDPSLILASRGIDTSNVLARWEPYLSTEPALVLARSRRALAAPGGVTLSLAGDRLVATGRAPAQWIARAETLAPAIAGVSSVDLAGVTPGLPEEMEAIRATIDGPRVLFASGSGVLDARALAAADSLAARFRALAAAARRNGYTIAFEVVGRADPSGTADENMNLSRRRVIAVRDRLVALGVPPAWLTVRASGSTDPLSAASPAEHARLNRSVSFTVQARPGSRVGAEERMR